MKRTRTMDGFQTFYKLLQHVRPFITTIQQCKYKNWIKTEFESQNLNSFSVSLRQPIAFGICLPASCSADHFESTINHVIHRKIDNISVQIDKQTCQSKDNSIQFKTIDWITLWVMNACIFYAIQTFTLYSNVCHFATLNPFGIFTRYWSGLLGILLCLASLSTVYDFIFTVNDRKLAFFCFFNTL